MTEESEQILWIVMYCAAYIRGQGYEKERADNAVSEFRNSQVFYPPVPPDKWDDEDVPY